MIRTPARHTLVLFLAALPAIASAQAPDSSSAADSARVYFLDGLNVTALRGARTVFATPAPVTVVDGRELRERGLANAADAFLDLPGLDAEGVGPTQRRPVIRGMRGQRVLLMEDGLRLNNARRRADSGEPTGLVWLTDVERVEVVRGPASVLYGSDAIGGVINLVSRTAPSRDQHLSGSVEVGSRTAGSTTSLSASVRGAVGSFGYSATGGYRDADPYSAPGGTFGTLTLPGETVVQDSGGRERSLRLEGRWEPAPGRALFLRHEAYGSRDSGFGWIDPELVGAASKTRLWWPEQDFRRTVAGYRSANLEVTAYHQDNERRFLTEVEADLPAPPGAALSVRSENFTDLRSLGLRAEARRLLAPDLLLVYGLDAYEDRSEGTDTSTTTISVSGTPVSMSGRGGPTIPDARLRNVGVFAQLQIRPTDRTELVAGARWQDVRSRTFATEGNEAAPVSYAEGTLVGTLNVIHRVGDAVSLVASAGRGFRTPNLVERFFTGLTGNGRGFWEANPELGPETSLNLEVGARVRAGRIAGEAFVFRNALEDGIVLEPTGETMGRATVYRNVNVDELRFRGADASVSVLLGAGLTLRGDAAFLDVEDPRDASRVVAETYPMKLGAELRWDHAPERGWIALGLRHNGERDTLERETPVGDRIPAFTVWDARAGLRLTERITLALTAENLTDALYAEALNTGFFRPEPGRSLSASLRAVF